MPDGINDFQYLLLNAIYKNKIKDTTLKLFSFHLFKFAVFQP